MRVGDERTRTGGMSNDLAENVSVSGSAVASYISGFRILIENAAYAPAKATERAAPHAHVREIDSVTHNPE
jgi:hypothetical protein